LGQILNKYGFPTVAYKWGEKTFFDGYVDTILAKKRVKGRIEDRIASELAEASVDFLMESLSMDRFWSRGKIHYDFSNKDGSVRLEVKTRKKYLDNVLELDVRLDNRDLKNGKEATHFVPTVYWEDGSWHYTMMPGVLDFNKFIDGCEIHKEIIPKDWKLKFPCTRSPWSIVLDHPKDFGYTTWENFKTVFTV
jgi:hypothetical protein